MALHSRAPAHADGLDLKLPQPDPGALAVSTRLRARLVERIRKSGGVLAFDQYMHQALYEPGLGYYANGMAKFGPEGDFVTAPEMGGLFARAVARQCADVLRAMGGGDILEFGAGSGRLARQALRELQSLHQLPERYYILELSASLRALQQETLESMDPVLKSRVVWLDAMPEPGFRGCVIANEVLDALPVKRFRKQGAKLQEEMVCEANDVLALRYETPGDELKLAVDAVERRLGRGLSDGYRSEVCTLLPDWMNALDHAMGQGLVLLVDYGYTGSDYYRPERNRGTLICFHRHRAHEDPLRWPGLCDITANVDFSAAAHAAHDAGFEVSGFTTQAFFLMGNGLETMLAESDPEDTVSHLRRSQEAKTLTLPARMGERFNVLALSKDLDLLLPAFQPADWRGRL